MALHGPKMTHQDLQNGLCNHQRWPLDNNSIGKKPSKTIGKINILASALHDDTKIAAKMPKMTTKSHNMAQGPPTVALHGPKMALHGPKMTHRDLQNGPCNHQRWPLGNNSIGQKPSKTIGKINILASALHDDTKMAAKMPKMTIKNPNMATKTSQSSIPWAQDGFA